MSRVLSGVALFCELAALAMFGVALEYGRFDQGIFFFLYIFGLIVALCAALAWSMPRNITVRVITHGALLVGCAVFAFPFVWLLGTGFQYNEEIFTYPPKWIPSFPQRVLRFPYVTAELHEAIERPSQLTRARWTGLWPRLEQAI